jgi:hypothetical protein
MKYFREQLEKTSLIIVKPSLCAFITRVRTACK